MFVFGETPAQAARMGYDIAQQNRQAFTRANELEADYAFRTNQMERADAQNMAALARAQQQEQNQLARESFMFGEQAKQQAKADAMAKLEFDTERKDVERQFAFEEKQLKRKDELAADQADNSGASLAYNLSTLLPIQKAAKKRADDAAAEIKRVIDQGTNLGFRYDEAGKRLIDAGGGRGNVDSFNRALTMARLELNDAKSKIPDIDREVNAARSQALNSGFSITPDALRNIKSGKVFPLTFATATTASSEAGGATVNQGANLRIGPDGRLIPAAGAVPPRAATPARTQPDSQNERQDFNPPTTAAASAGLPQGQQQQIAVARQRPYTFGPGLEQAPLDTVKAMYDAQAARIRANNAGRGAPLESEVPSSRFGFPRSPVMESLTDPIANKLAEVLRISPQQIGQSNLYRTAAAQAKALLEGKYGDVIWDELSEEEKRTILVEALQNSQRDPYTRKSGYTGFEFR